jgi:hypothetical protein
VHGEEKSSRSFAETLQSELDNTPYIPEWRETVDLNTMKGEVESIKSTESNPAVDKEIESLSHAVKLLIDKYETVKYTKTMGEMRKLREDIKDVREMMRMINDEM